MENSLENSTPPEQISPSETLSDKKDAPDYVPQEQSSPPEALVSDKDVPTLIVDTDSAPQEQKPPSGTNPVNLGFAVIVAFALGVALGFFGRPAIIAENPTVLVETVVVYDQAVAQSPASTAESTTNSPPTTEAASENNDSAAEPVSPISSPTPEPAEQPAADAPTPTIMEFVMSDARHWQGEEEALITIVEFSDFK